LVVLFLGFFSANQESGSGSTSLEHKLAQINAGRLSIDKDDITVKRFHYLLDSLHAATGVEREMIADKVVWAQGELRDRYGKDVTVLGLMETLNQMRGQLSSQRGPKNFDAILAMLVVLTGTR
jgi:hypothetical protein